ncbi:hypothetical protein NLI96_g1048 [Meripilus lineatus]|uniref:Uncharacterized protein n=1 Tax=Meripilus lineatus TaxID=2056292 RepID=A0AAD5VB91_9APHY|nr:hypothetical protein NLI96_g1048 [Physisporinus lineatus]
MVSTPRPEPEITPGFREWLTSGDDDPGDLNLSPGEAYWRDLQPWLQEKGYMLRPRYRPGWVSSAPGGRDPLRLHEDSIRISVCHYYLQVRLLLNMLLAIFLARSST